MLQVQHVIFHARDNTKSLQMQFDFHLHQYQLSSETNYFNPHYKHFLHILSVSVRVC